MRIYNLTRIVFIVSLLCASRAFAEPTVNVTTKKITEADLDPVLYESAVASGKTAYVNMGRLFRECAETQAAVAVLQSEMEQKMPERNALQAELEKISKEGGGREAVKEQWDKIQQYDQQLQTAMSQRQNEVFAPVFESIDTAVKKFGAQNGYRIIYAGRREGAEDVTAAVLKQIK